MRTATHLLDNPNYRFTIRTVGGKELRKLMTGDRFRLMAPKYSPTDVRVDIYNVTDPLCKGQTWDLSLTKWFGSN